MTREELMELLAIGDLPSAVPVSHRDFIEQGVRMGWFIVTPDGLETTPEYEAFNDGSPHT